MAIAVGSSNSSSEGSEFEESSVSWILTSWYVGIGSCGAEVAGSGFSLLGPSRETI